MLAKRKVKGPSYQRAQDIGHPGAEDTVESAHAAKADLEDLKVRYAEICDQLREYADAFKVDGVPSVRLAGIGDRIARVTWQRSRRSLGEEDLPGVQAALGSEVASEVLTETIGAKFARQADIPSLLLALCDAGYDPRRWFDVASAWDVDDAALKRARGAHPELREQLDQLDAETLTHTPKVYLEVARATKGADDE
jgi:hypothetical protein